LCYIDNENRFQLCPFSWGSVVSVDELWHTRFEGRGYRLTTPREATLHVLSNADKYLSSEDIYMTVHRKYPAIGLTTIYRTLDLLVRMGVVFKFGFGDGRAHYELTEHFSNKKHNFQIAYHMMQLTVYVKNVKHDKL
jgi:Fur family ferric uptake transcriptional regulator